MYNFCFIKILENMKLISHKKGIIIVVVLSIIALIAAKCCGVEIDPIGKIKKLSDELRDRWKWLDKQLNKFKVCFVKNRNFGQKSKCWSKIEILINIELLVKN